VVAEAIKGLRAAATDVTIETTSYELGAQRWHRSGRLSLGTVLSELAGHDAILPGATDMLVVREGTEGPYTEAGGVMRKGTPGEVATQESINTAFGAERVAG
jgi:3-isopropylmalate dehydrogenase